MRNKIMPIALSVTLISQPLSGVVYSHDNEINISEEIVESQQESQKIDISDENLKEEINSELDKNNSSNTNNVEDIPLDTLNTNDNKVNTEEEIIESKQGNQIVNIPDENLKRAINNSIGQSEDSDITIEQLESITELYTGRVENLEGIQYCINLKELSISSIEKSQLSDISYLSKLTNLEYLHLTGNSIDDISHLLKLTNLEYLEISNGKISDISGISSLINLTFLDLNSNEIRDISELSSLTNLEYLYLDKNQITDFRPLSKLNITNYAWLYDQTVYLETTEIKNNQVTMYIPDIYKIDGSLVEKTPSWLYGADDYEIFKDRIIWNNIDKETTFKVSFKIDNSDSITFIQKAIKSQESNDKNQIVNIPDENLKEAINKSIGQSEGSDITIEQLESITELIINSTENSNIENLEGIQYCTNLKRLSICGTESSKLSDISYLSNLTNLEYLYLPYNQISDISPLSNLINLDYLKITYGNIEDISPLSNLVNLRVLDLHDNQISDINPLSNLNNLQTIYLDGNQITDFRPLSSIYNPSKVIVLNFQVAYLETTEIKNNQVTMYIPPIYDIKGNLLKTPDYCYGGNDYEILEDRIIWSNIDKETTFRAVFDDVTLVQKAVVSNEKPVINANDITLNVGDEFEPLKGVSASDKEDGEITKIEVKGDEVDTSKVGEYKVIYEVTDSYGNTVSKEIKVNVINDKNQIVNIPDQKLKKAINKRIGQSEGSDITIGQLESITSLYINNGVEILEGLQYCVNLNYLNLGWNKISDISALENLTNLSNLSLNSNQISDISALENLTNLNYLYLYDNQISDISALENLTNLNYLDLSGNEISEIKGLDSLINLQTLYLSGNQISGISALENLTNLNDLDLSGNEISEIKGLDSLINLQTLYLSGNQISGISALGNLTNLNYLDLYDNQISDISALGNLTNLNYLDLYDNQISDISALGNLTNLNYLNLSGNKISEIKGLDSLINLQTLYLSGNQISDISPLGNLTNLNYLDLYNNQISDISVLENLKYLKTLDLTSNQIGDISALDNLNNLMNLYLNYNKITDLTPLSNFSGSNDIRMFIANQSIDLGTVEINNNQVTMNIPPIYDIDGELIKPEPWNGEYDYEVFEDRIVWNDVDKESAFTVCFEDEFYVIVPGFKVYYSINVSQKAIKPVRSNEKPVITASDITLKVGDKFEPLSGVSATDEEDGEITNIVVKGDEVDTSKVGEYKVIYEVTDKDGNTVSKDIKVVVRSNEKPVISASDVTLKVGDKFEPLSGVSASDEEDGEITNILVKGDKVDTSKVGEYKVIYEVTDKDGNTVSKEIKVTVRSNEKPVISANDVTLKVGDKFEPLSGVSASDEEDGEITNIVVKGDKVDTSKVGEYKVIYEVTDKDGNTVSKEIKVTVRSNEKPIIIGTEDKFIELGGKFDPLVGITASDYEDGDITQNIKIEGDVNVNQVGEYKLTYTVIDSDGNITTEISIITVNYKKEDINNDGVIDIVDLANIASDYNNNSEDENWNEKYDINNDGIIDIFDLVLISKGIEQNK